MSVSLLSVQFRNLLPSEELLLFARARWNDAQASGALGAHAGDATLRITQTASKGSPFEVCLTLPGSTLSSVAHASTAVLAVESAFAQLGTLRGLSVFESHTVEPALDEMASDELDAVAI